MLAFALALLSIYCKNISGSAVRRCSQPARSRKDIGVVGQAGGRVRQARGYRAAPAGSKRWPCRRVVERAILARDARSD